MAVDVAKLGIEVDSAPLQRAAKEMDNLSVAAAKVDRSVTASTAATDKASTSAKSHSQQVQALNERLTRQAEQMARLQTAADNQSKINQSLSAQLAEQAKLYDFVGEKSRRQGKDTAAAVGLARHELINLSRQAQDVAVSLAGGQSPLMVLMQQGSQIGDAFASSKSSIGGFATQAKNFLGGFLTAGRVAFGGVAIAAATAGLALNSYLDTQNKVQASLLGAGRASGATSSTVNNAADRASSLTGFSIGEARELASALAATGKIGKDSLAPIAEIGHDIAIAFGTDAKGAADILAKAFSNPVQGAQDLNEKLGFLDAATERQIANLVAQNRMYEAQQLLLVNVKTGLVGYSETVSEHTKLWTILGNVISTAWDAAGRYAARALGLTSTLQEKIDAAKKNLDELRAGTSNTANAEFAATGLGTGYEQLPSQMDPVKIAAAEKEYERLLAVQEKLNQSFVTGATAQQSFAQQNAIRALAPEIAQREALNNQLKLMENLLDSISNDEAGGARLKALNITFAELVKLVEKARTESSGFRTELERLQSANKIAMDATTAFSPKARADIAKREALDRYSQDPNAQTIAQDAYNLSLKQSTVALTEVARARALSAQQAVDSSKLEIDLVGKSIGQQAEARGNMQARQTLEVKPKSGRKEEPVAPEERRLAA